MADYAISNVARRVVYTNTGVGPYAFTFEILANTDIAVYRGSTLLTLTTDYSVTINANGTGSVTLVTAGTGNITIVGARAIQRTSDYTTGGDLFASTLNTDLDSQTIYAQQVAETAERGLKAPVVDPTDINMTLPAKASRVGTVLAFNATTGNPEAGPSIASVTTVAAQSANINTVATNIASVNTVAGISANVTTVAGVSGNVTTVASNITNVNAVGADLLEAVSEINTVATDIANVNTVGTNISSVNTVAGEIGAGQDVTVVATDLSGTNTIGTVATNIANVNATGTNIANVNAVGADLLEPVSEINTVATDITNVNTVGTNIANVNTVAGVSANVTTVAGISANVTTVAGISANVTTVATNNANVTTVATNIASVNTCATDIAQIITTANDLNEAVSEIETVANNIANVNTVGTNIANVNTVAGISANVTTVATNVADINNYADTYQGAKASDPSLRNDGSALQSGDLYFNTTDDVMKVREAGAWLAAYASLSGALIAANNLSDLTSTATARTNLDLGTGNSPTFTTLNLSSNLTFTGTGNRITGDFSNATATNAVAFQTSTTNGNTNIRVIPNGTGVNTNIVMVNNSDPTNASTMNIGVFGSTDGRINSTISGTGTYLPLTIYTGGSERVRIDTSGNFGISTTTPSTYGKFAVVGASSNRAFYADANAQPVARYDDNSFISAGFTLRNTGLSGSNQGIGLLFQLGASGTAVNSGSIEMRSEADYSTSANQDAAMTFATVLNGTASERMRIDSSGNVGINTTSPGVKLGVVDTSAGAATFPAIFGNRGTTVSTQANIGLQTYDAGSAGITNVIGSVTTSATGGAGSADMVFQTTGSGTRAERMRITSGGNVQLSTANTSILNSSGNPILRQTGSVLQVVSATKTNTASTTSTTPVDTGLELTITPVSSTSKILLMTTVMASQSAIKRIYFRFAGGNSSAAIGDANTGHEATFSINSRSGDSYIMLPGCASYLDSPATTSAITYKIQWWVESDTGYLNRPGTIDANGANTVSTITAMEIAA